MATQPHNPDNLQIRLTSLVESIRAALDPYVPWIEQTLGVSIDQTLTLGVDSNPADAVAAQLVEGLALTSEMKSRVCFWQSLIEHWALPPGTSPAIAASIQRERRPKTAPLPVWDLDWQDCPVALKLRGLQHYVLSIKVPLVFPPTEVPMFARSSLEHRLIVHWEDAAKVLLLVQKVQNKAERYLETENGQIRLQARYDWDSVVMDAAVRRMVRTDFELFFQRESWFRQHNLPYRRSYLLWGLPGNGKTATIRVMACHPYIKPFALDLSDIDNKSGELVRLFGRASENTPALIILEDLDRAFPSEGKRTKERTVSFQTLLNCLDGVATQDGIIVVATANDPTCLDPAILKRPGRFDRVVQFRSPDAELRRQYYERLNPILAGDQFETAIQKTKGFSFAQLRESYVAGAQIAFEQSRAVTVADVIDAIELQTSGAHELRAARPATGFVRSADRSARH